MLTHLACGRNLLKWFLDTSTPFIHDRLVDLTIRGVNDYWDGLLSPPAGQQLFAQLTHLRVCMRFPFQTPDFRFTSLTHFSYIHDGADFNEAGNALPPDPVRFPVLHQVVPTIPSYYIREADPRELREAGRSVDPRFDVLCCPRDWNDADVWERSRRGEEDLWTRARSVEY
jgi:hypothetical protein